MDIDNLDLEIIGILDNNETHNSADGHLDLGQGDPNQISTGDEGHLEFYPETSPDILPFAEIARESPTTKRVQFLIGKQPVTPDINFIISNIVMPVGKQGANFYLQTGAVEEDESPTETRLLSDLGNNSEPNLSKSRAETIDYLAHPQSTLSLLPSIAEEKPHTPTFKRSFSHDPTSDTKPIIPIEPEKDVSYGFVELHVLSGESEICDKEWKQTARWIKYEEDLEEGSQRWGKAHVATLSFHSLFKLRQLIERDGLVLPDMEERDMPGIAYRVVEELSAKGIIRTEDSPLLMRILLLKHRHVEESEGGSWFRMRRTNTSTASTVNMQNVLDEKHRNRSIVDTFGLTRRESLSKGFDTNITRGLQRTSSGNYLRQPVTNGSGVDHISVEVKGLSETYCPSEEDLKWIQGKEHIIRRLPTGAVATLILVGTFDTIRRPLFLFIRLKEAAFIFNVSEIPVPIRFVTLIIVPPNNEMDLLEVGRVFGTLMSNKDFADVANSAATRKNLLAGINEFLDESIVLPPGDWNNRDLLPLHILQAKSKMIHRRRIKKQPSFVLPPPLDRAVTVAAIDTSKKSEKTSKGASLINRTGYPFGGVWADMRRRYPQYWSDIVDGLNFQCFATMIFMYCASIAQVITFAGLIGEKTGNHIGMSETLIVSSGAGIIFSLISGQPLIPIGPTGPLLVFDEILFQSCTRMNIEFLPLRFWISAWLLVIILIVSFFEGAVLAKWFTRFTQDIFATLTSVLFLFESVENLVEIYVHHPLGSAKLDTRLISVSINTTHYSAFYEETTPPPILDESEDLRRQPNTALLSTILMLGTFFIAYFLREFRNSVFLGERLRRALCDFGVPIAVFTMVFLDYSATDTYTRKMKVPSGMEPSDPDIRDWVVDILGRNGDFEVLYAFLAVFPALLLFILIFMTTQICELMVNKEERKMRKGGGFHMDLLIIAFVNVVCGIMGGPWLCTATIRGISHVTALTVYSVNNPPGEKPTIVEVKEQRLSNFALSVLIGCSVLLAPVLQHIPLAVLFGVFLYMGVSSLSSTQLFDRFSLLFIPARQHPPTIYVRRVRTWKLHLYTIIQLGCLGLLWGVKSIKEMALAFPFVLMLLVPIRIQLKYIFDDSELEALDGEGAK